jgi:hypothetical protein
MWRRRANQASVKGEIRSGDAGRELRLRAWQWAQADRSGDGSLPSGREIGLLCGVNSPSTRT